MKKVFLVMQKKDAAQALVELRELSLLHVEHIQEPHGHHLLNFKEETQNLVKALNVLAPLASSYPQKPLVDWQTKVAELVKALSDQAILEEDLIKRRALVHSWQPWGEFDPEDIRQLARRGLTVQLLEVTPKEAAKLSKECFCQIIANQGSVARCAVVTEGKKEFPYTSVEIPAAGLHQMKEELEKEEKRLKDIHGFIKDAASYYESLHRIYAQRKEVQEYEEIKSGLGSEDQLAYLKAFIPANQSERLRQAALKHRWGLLIEEPASDDKVPTLLDNPKWVQWISPVFDFMSIIPGYREADVSFCFLAFFSIFFGMLIGDAGYGALFLGLTVFAHVKAKGKITDPKPFYLIYILSAVTIIWGCLTGTLFGVSLFGKFFKPMVPWLGDEKNVQLLCFIIGAVHLTIAHLWRGLRKMPSFLALSDVGWIAIVWSAFFYAQQFILNQPLPSFVNPMGAVAFVVIILFSQSLQDIAKDFVGFGIGILLTVLTVISTLIDVISYIRLYAVGIAGLSLAEAFNQMALAAGFKNLFIGILSIAILLAGHGLNIILGIMAIMVHGLRLNILEFSGHLSLEWSGVKYEPFRRTVQGEV